MAQPTINKAGGGVPLQQQQMMISAAQVANQKQNAAAQAQALAQAQAMAQAKMLAAQKQQQMMMQQHMQQQMLMASKPQPTAAFNAAAVNAAATNGAAAKQQAMFAAAGFGTAAPTSAATGNAAVPFGANSIQLAAAQAAAAQPATAANTATADTIAAFGATTAAAATDASYRRVNVPAHRLSPLQASWPDLYKPIVEHMKLQIRFNTKKKAIELRTTAATPNGALQKSSDFIRAFLLGFELRDAVALLRLDDIYIDSFEIKDVKRMEGEHLSRAIGRIAGAEGKTKYTIENSTHTRVVLADTHIHILGSFQNIRTAKDALVNLIRGSAPGKVYTQMRSVANRIKEK